MADPVKFLCDVMGLDGHKNPHHRPGSILNAINSGQLFLDPELMKTSHGADVLNKLVSTVCQRGIRHINQLDASNKHTGLSTMQRYERLVDRLVESGVDPWMAGKDGTSPWELAVSRGWEGACMRFLQHPSCPKGVTLGNGRSVQNAGADNEVVDPWIVAAARHDMVPVLEALLKDATEINGADFTGNSALHHAASLQAVELLLDAGINSGIRNRSGVSAEEKWIERVRREQLDAKESKRMSAALLLKRMEHGDPKTQAADLVAEAGQHMGVRDGEPILRKAGWKNPKNALTSKNQTIFATRAEDAMNKGFRLRDFETLVNASEYTGRATKILTWMSKDKASAHDQGLARLLMWHLRGLDRNKQWNGARAREFTAFETKLKLRHDIEPAEQQKAINALKDAVARGTIGNGSFVAGTALASVLGKGPNVAELFVAHQGQDPLLIQWLDLVYRGMGDPAWNRPGAFVATTRPDTSLNEMFDALDTKIDLAPGEFWTHPKLPGLFLRVAGSRLGGKEGYGAPLKCDYDKPNPATVANLCRHAERWVASMDASTLLKAASKDPVSGRIFQALRAHIPQVATLAEQAAIHEATVPANAPARRRSL